MVLGGGGVQMGLRWLTKMGHIWVTDESHIGCTFEYNISYLLLQTYQSLIPSQTCYTSNTKSECNFWPIWRNNPVVFLTTLLWCVTSWLFAHRLAKVGDLWKKRSRGKCNRNSTRIFRSQKNRTCRSCVCLNGWKISLEREPRGLHWNYKMWI